MRFAIAAVVLIGVGTFGAPARAQNCTTTQNPITKAVETRCSDGSSSTGTRNPITGA